VAGIRSRDGNVLFILSPSAYSVQDFGHMLLKLPMDIKDAMYVEGGSQATLSYNLKGTAITVLGRCGSPVDQDGKDIGPELPNVIGVSRRRP
jgi:hypothetical protein